MQVLGIDIGGSGIKGAVVDLTTGELVTERHRIPTPQPATPEQVANTVAELVEHFAWKGPVGCGFPAAIQHGIARTAANIDKSFIGTDVAKLFSNITECPCYVLNDADAAGVTEMHFGAGRGIKGVVLMVTIGTGLGTALFSDGKLLPNTELGHILLENGLEGEQYASSAVREREELGWGKWGKRFNTYLQQMEALFWPDIILLGGGASKKFEKFSDKIEVDALVTPAASLNQAGIIGAALYAAEQHTGADLTQLPA
ncbi:ROK family protein [Corallincola holothuriorum]|uniref:ROK family protein n=1 Tax=Corallincola holothuriorum TaxID=2282215 RepID=A0A368NN38_9GAMM|nr:ROK family protein [Corallincola holothuriorum]RCU51500.1 ROK family protein [Corallincola holothuriorum]